MDQIQSELPKLIDMPEDLREMMLKIFDGDHRALPLLHRIFGSPYRRPILRWLVSHRMTGAQFVSWFQFECQGSPMYMIAVLEARVLRKSKPRLMEEMA